MARTASHDSEPVNSDSFLDIVASVVSIMIIMVVMEGSRIRNAPVKVALPADPTVVALQKELTEEQAMRGDVVKAAQEIQSLQQETIRRGSQRDMLATMASAVEHAIGEHRQRLTGAQKTNFDLARDLSESKFQLEQLNRQQQQAENAAAAPVVVESYPTPLSKAVDGPEVHFLVANGHVAAVPLDLLIEEFQAKAKRQLYRFRDESEVTEVVGPIDGFRLRYTLERYDVTPAENNGHGGSFVRVQKWTLLPESHELGEPIATALSPESEFRRVLRKNPANKATITIWIYPDGFDAFRQLRKELYPLNYTIAARPLPFGVPISGSPEGSKSAAQ
jgi:hypothetical protein